MFRGLFSIYPNLALSHDALKIQGVPPPLQPGGRNESFPVPYRPLVVGAAAGLFRKKLNAVGEVDVLPGRIVAIRAGRFLRCLPAFEQLPAHIHAVNVPLRHVFRQAERPGHGIGSRRRYGLILIGNRIGIKGKRAGQACRRYSDSSNFHHGIGECDFNIRRLPGATFHSYNTSLQIMQIHMSSGIFRLTWKACFFIVDSPCTGLSRSPGPSARLSVP